MNNITSRAIVAILVVVAMLMVISGCDNSNEQTNNNNTSQNQNDNTANDDVDNNGNDENVDNDVNDEVKEENNNSKVNEKNEENEENQETDEKEKPLSGEIVMVTNMTNLVDTTLKDLANEFMSINKDVTVEVEGMANPKTELTTLMAANELPDVTLVLAGTKKTDYKNYFEPLDDLGYSEDSLYFYEDGLGDDGKLYKICPNLTYYCSVVYNKKVFKESGVDEIPTTLDEFFEACELIKSNGIIPVATNFKDKWPLSIWTHQGSIVNTGNVNYINELVNTDTILKDDNGMLETLEIVKRIVDEGYSEPDLMSTNWDQFYQSDLGSGKTAMSLIGPWLLPYVVEGGADPDDLGVFPFPWPDNAGYTVTSDWYFAVSKYSDNKDSAKAFLKYMIDEGRYAKAKTADASTVIGLDGINPFTSEIISYDVNVYEIPGRTDKYNEIVNKGQINFNNLVQEYVLAEDVEVVIDKYNEQWAKARAAVNE